MRSGCELKRPTLLIGRTLRFASMRVACAAIVALTCACPTVPYRAYEGPELPREQLAILRAYDERNRQPLDKERHVRFETINGEFVQDSVTDAYVLPGRVELEVSLFELTLFYGTLQFPQRLAFEAQAGHEYAFQYRRSRHSPPFAFRVMDRGDAEMVRRSRRQPPLGERATEAEPESLVADTECTVDSCRARVAHFERAGWATVDWYHVGRWHSVSWSPADDQAAERVEMLFGAGRNPDFGADAVPLDFADAATLHSVALDFGIAIERAHEHVEWRVIEESPAAVSSAWSGVRKEGGEPWAGVALFRPANGGLQAGLYERRGPPLSPADIAAWQSALDEARLP